VAPSLVATRKCVESLVVFLSLVYIKRELPSPGSGCSFIGQKRTFNDEKQQEMLTVTGPGYIAST
jgi:hypothetical protein